MKAMAVAGVSANRLELLQIADSVAREKTIDRKIVIEAMEDAIQKAAKSRYGAENDIRCEIDPKTGETRLSRVMAVVEDVENDSTQINLADAKRRNPDAKIGDFIAESLPPLDFGRVAAQNAKQVIVQKVREAERSYARGKPGFVNETLLGRGAVVDGIHTACKSNALRELMTTKTKRADPFGPTPKLRCS